MKVKLYVDVYPGITPECMWFTAKPGVKAIGGKRLSFEVAIPDELINDVDYAVATEVSAAREVDAL